ncbi:NADPH-dependent diflavin oxidoreductase 1 isoform X1 [Tanacetum coccineum]
MHKGAYDTEVNAVLQDAPLDDKENPGHHVTFQTDVQYIPPDNKVDDELRSYKAIDLWCLMDLNPVSLWCLMDLNPTLVRLQVVKNHPISRAGCGKDVRPAFSSTIEYEVGDVLEILPGQSPEAIDAFMKRCNLNPESYIVIAPRNKEDNLENGERALNVPIKLRRFVELTMDIASASPRRYFFEVMSFFATAEHEKERLLYFASPEGRDDLYQYNQKERRTVLEVLEDFPSVNMPFEWLVQLIPSLKTQAFSIYSSQLVHPNQVHITVSIVSWTTPFKRKRIGLCSNWLASLDPHQTYPDIYMEQHALLLLRDIASYVLLLLV